MKCIQLLLNNNDKFIFGNHRKTVDDHYTSDRLFSNLVINLDKIGYSLSEIEEVINKFEDSTKISSLLWGLNIIDKKDNIKSGEIYFLPFPKANIDSESINEKKKMSHIKYISIEAFKKLTYIETEEGITISSPHKTLNEDFITIQDKFIISKDEIEETETNIKLFNKSIKDHNVIDRTTGFSENVYFNDYLEVNFTETNNYMYEPFMYFLLDGEITDSIEKAIKLIKYDAIGGKKSIGNGKVENVIIKDFSNNEIFQRNSKLYTNLSVVIPKDKEELQGVISYSVEKRNGYVYSSHYNNYINIEKQSIYIIQEGAIFRNKIQGKIADVTPSIIANKIIHRVYRYGKALLLPLGGVDDE